VTLPSDDQCMATLDALSSAEAWLGAGWRAPVVPSQATGGAIVLIRGMELVRQSIETILDTEPGERVMVPAFGCGLRRFLMAPNTTSVRTAIQAEVTQALTLWEPRIRLTEVTVTPGEDGTLVWIDISYVRLVDLRPDNLVYPFYLK
jgi:phage baseplate assembly protein W